jgi:CHAT domain-containing protein/tetratricopeptide (TPR) repeat protein
MRLGRPLWLGGLYIALAGACAQAQGDPFGHCLDRFAQAPDRWESARCFFDVGQSEGRMDEAARRLELLRKSHPDRLWLRLAQAYVEEGRDVRRATERYRQAVAAFVEAHDVAGEVRARCAFTTWLSRQGNLAGASEQLALARRSAEISGNHDALAEELIFQARYLRNQGTGLHEPYRLASQAETILFPHGDVVRQMLCLELLALLDRELGRPDPSAQRYQRLERLARNHERQRLVATAQLGLGMLLFEELDRAPRISGRERVAAQLKKALATAEEAGEPQLQAASLALLAHLVSPPEGQDHLERCLSLARDRDDTLTTSCLISLARLQAETDEAAAERTLKEAESVAMRARDPASLARFWNGRMNLHWRFGPRDRAVADSFEAIRAVEALRDRELEQKGRAGLFSRWLTPYYAASGHLLLAFQRSGDPRDLDLAFSITESMRARVLRDLLASPRSPEPPLSRETLERSLAPDEALLSFQIAPRKDLVDFGGGPWLLVSTRGGTRVYPLPEGAGRANLETAVPALLGLIERRDESDADLASSLGSNLLGKALADLPRDVARLVVVPDGILHLLPFAALRLDRQGPPLAEKYQITMASSATLWERWRRQAGRPARTALVLADPFLAEAGDPLPDARREARRVARSCGPGSVVRFGPEAGEGFLKRQDLSRFGVLHLAAHAVADESSPEASAVLLAADAPGEDGRLQVDEISRLDLRGSLVALSSCRSASGALVGGEGVMSLSRAFFAAGSAAVVGSLWPLRDDDAEAFFEIFYGRLADGDTAAAAFSAAQRQRLRDRAPAEAWAGFVLSGNGNWRLPPAPGSPESPNIAGPAALAAGGLLALAAVFFWMRRRAQPGR